jgi:hypothetical protein
LGIFLEKKREWIEYRAVIVGGCVKLYREGVQYNDLRVTSE